MNFSKIFLHLVIGAFFFIQAVFAKPRGGFVTLINATPYDWKLTSSHSYQVDWDFPSVVKAGTSHEQYVKFKKDHHDDGAEAYYSLVNSRSPASFILKARSPKHIEIQFQDTLSSLNNPENSVINLGFVQNGAVSFVLSGNGGGLYISSNPPVAWMQSILSSIGSNSLREIAMPASHDSGMNEVTLSWGGVPHNTKTQTANTFKQLINGARVFDIRPLYWHGRLYTGHFSKFGSGAVGGTGREIPNIVKDINTFTNQHPGELIILDISHQMNADRRFRDFGPKIWAELYEELNKIQALWVPSTSNFPGDLSSLPLSTFITPGSKSAVLVRLPKGAPLPQSGRKSRSFMKQDVAAVATYAGTAGADPTDGITAQGPAVEGDDNDNSTAIDNDTITPTPTSLPPALSTYGGADSSTSDDDPDFPANGSPIDASPASMAPFPISTDIPTAEPELEPMPAEVPVPMGTSGMAFFHESRLPITGSYTDTDKSKRLIADQLAKLVRERPNPQAPVHKSTWTITQRWRHITDAGNPKTSITADAVAAHRALLSNLWSAMSRNTYPNMIEVDDIYNSQITTLCMAINDYFASPRISYRSTRTLVKRGTNVTMADISKPESNTGILEAIGYGKPKRVRLSESGCDVVEILFKNRQWCWNIMTPQEKEYWEQKKTQLEENYVKKEKKKVPKDRGNVEKDVEKIE
jgi:hypothetical protein